MNLIGYKEADDGWWFLIKDSASGARNGKHSGYYFLPRRLCEVENDVVYNL